MSIRPVRSRSTAFIAMRSSKGCARMVIAIADSSKFGRICLHRIISCGELDMLITDADAPEAIRQASEQFGFQLLLA